MPDDCERLSRRHTKGDVTQNPIFVRWLAANLVTEPDVAKFDFATRIFEPNGFLRGLYGYGFIEQLENPFARGHGGLQNVKFFAEVLNRPEEALGPHRVSRQNAKGKSPLQYAHSASPVNQSDRRETQEFHRRIKQRVSKNSVAPGQHVFLVAFLEILHRFLLAIEELHNAHACDVFLQERVDAGDGRADAAIRIAHVFAENQRDDQNAGKNRKRRKSKAPIQDQKPNGKRQQQEEVINHGNDAGSKQIV